jgi:hypothetical protein
VTAMMIRARKFGCRMLDRRMLAGNRARSMHGGRTRRTVARQRSAVRAGCCAAAAQSGTRAPTATTASSTRMSATTAASTGATARMSAATTAATARGKNRTRKD